MSQRGERLPQKQKAGCKRNRAAPGIPVKSSGLTNALLFYHAVCESWRHRYWLW